MTKDLRVDWFRIFADLKRQGLSMRMVSKRIGVPLSSLQKLKGGTDPAHSTGEVIIEFWCACADKAREAVPKVDPHDRRD
jgi:predicted transcriptional regulator